MTAEDADGDRQAGEIAEALLRQIAERAPKGPSKIPLMAAAIVVGRLCATAGEPDAALAMLHRMAGIVLADGRRSGRITATAASRRRLH